MSAWGARGPGRSPTPLQVMVARLRAGGIVDERILEAMTRVPREEFVTEGFEQAAYEDRALPIGYRQSISQPLMTAHMLQAMELRGGERVLDVGTGSGYLAAVVAELGAASVVSVERIPGLATAAGRRLRRLGYAVEVITADGSAGSGGRGPFDVVVCGAVAPAPPRSLLDELAEGGRLVIPLRWAEHNAGDERLYRLRRVSGAREGRVVEDLGQCRFVPLVGEEGYAPEAG